MFSWAYSLLRGFLCHKQTCTVTVIHYCIDDHKLITLAPLTGIDRLPDISDNRNLCLPHLHSTPLFGGSCWNIAMMFCTEKLELVWLPSGKKILKIQLIVLTEFTDVTDRQTDTAWWHRLRLHSIARQKLSFFERDKSMDHIMKKFRAMPATVGLPRWCCW